jgi:MFS family permease
MGVADVLASPLLGKRSDQIGYRRVLIISLIGAAAFTLPQAFATNYAVFLALRFGVGMFLGGILPAANALAGRLFPRERRGHIFGLVSSATFVGMFLGPLCGGLISARFGFTALFLTVGAIMLVNMALVIGLREGTVAQGRAGPPGLRRAARRLRQGRIADGFRHRAIDVEPSAAFVDVGRSRVGRAARGRELIGGRAQQLFHRRR